MDSTDERCPDVGASGRNQDRRDGGRVQTEAEYRQPDAARRVSEHVMQAQSLSTDLQYAVDRHPHEAGEIQDARPGEHVRHEVAGRLCLSILDLLVVICSITRFRYPVAITRVPGPGFKF